MSGKNFQGLKEQAGGAAKDAELQNQLGWKRPLRSPSPTVTPGLPRPPLNDITEGLIYMDLEHFQGWRYSQMACKEVARSMARRNKLEKSVRAANTLGRATEDAVNQITGASQKAIDKASKAMQDGVEQATGHAAEAISGLGKKCGFEK